MRCRPKLDDNDGNMASKANNLNTPRSTNHAWLLCYIACYRFGFIINLLNQLYEQRN